MSLCVGALLSLLGLGYLYRPRLIERLVKFVRDYILNDAHLALERRKWGAFFLLLGAFFLYKGYTSLP